ncbi:MAG: hypothetical protein WCB31_10670, partial [Nitrososphaeraceae archaeon]
MKFHYRLSQKSVAVFFFTILCMMMITAYPLQFLVDLELISQKENNSLMMLAFGSSDNGGHGSSRGGGDDGGSQSSRGGGNDGGSQSSRGGGDDG